MPALTNYSTRYMLSLKPEIYKAIKKSAIQRGMTIAQFIRLSIDKELSIHNKEK